MFDIVNLLGGIWKIFTKRDCLLLLLIILLYFATRLINLDAFPIFSDEGIYIRWAKIAWHDASWRFISLTDGKQPLQTWGTIPFLKLFPDNALLAGRLFSVSTGFVTLAGVFSFLCYLFGKRSALFGAFFYVFTPYFMFYDRMALVDSGVNAAFIWILFFSVLLARSRRLDVALLFGFLGGMSALTKSSVRIFIGLSSLAFILFLERNKRKFLRQLTNFFSLYIVVGMFTVLIYNIQRLSPFFHYISEKNKTFVMTFQEFAQNPFAVFFTNVPLVPLYVLWEMAFFLGFCGVVGLILLYRKDKKLSFYFLLWLVVPYIVIIFLSKVIFPRYLIFFASLLLILASYFYSRLKNKKTLIAFVCLFIISIAYFDFTIVKDHKNIPFPPVDRGQYIEGWPAGWGVKSIIDFAREKSKEKPVIVLAEGNFGLSGDVLDTHLKPGDAISIRGFWPLEEKQLRDHQGQLDKNYVFIVVSHRLDYPQQWPAKFIARYDKPGNQSRIFLLELTK
ncbi:glycosyltransferase family 39 protein [Candidatus Roizmanbacteria bacterium]|nr:glycosyltransferase family 39 protein [Candidatus Roizmanbacteria bacterium]